MKTEEVKIINTSKEELGIVIWLFEQAMKLQGKNGYKVWETIDKSGLQREIENRLQYKIMQGGVIVCIFSVQYNDPFIWRYRDKGDAIYLHRIVVSPKFKGQRQFEKILVWAKKVAQENNLKYIRMDTWADNEKIINYYKSFGFEFVEYYITTNAPELPIQNQNLNVALLEMKL